MELCRYWPEFMAGLEEFKALAAAEEPELVAVLDAVRATPQDFFIETLSDAGAARWEENLGLPVSRGGDLKNRRFRIMTKATEQSPFTWRRLEELLATLCGEGGFSMALAGEEFTVAVRVALTAKQNYEDVGTLLERVVPTNMVIDLSLLYNQYWQMQGISHASLAQRTHYQLRNEVLPNGDGNGTL